MRTIDYIDLVAPTTSIESHQKALLAALELKQFASEQNITILTRTQQPRKPIIIPDWLK